MKFGPRQAALFLPAILLLMILLQVLWFAGNVTIPVPQLGLRESTSGNSGKARDKARNDFDRRLGNFLEPDGSRIRSHPLAREGEFENGFRYVIVPTPEEASRLSLRLVVEAGSLMEEEHELGLAHFLEHMAFNGSRTFPKGRAMEAFQKMGLRRGADSNATTSFAHTVYQLDIPAHEDEPVNRGFQFLRDVADGVSFDPEEIESERKIVLQELLYRGGDREQAYAAQLNALAPENRHAKRPPIGTVATLTSLERDHFIEFYHRWYTPNRMTLVVAGSVEIGVMESKIRKAFASMQPRPRAPDPEVATLSDQELSEISDQGETLSTLLTKQKNQDQITIAVATTPRPPEMTMRQHFQEDLVLEVMHAMVSHAWKSIRRHSRWDSLLDTRLSSRSSQSPAYLDLASLTLKSKAGGDHLYNFVSEWNGFREHGFTDEEFDLARKEVLRKARKNAVKLHPSSSSGVAERVVECLRKGRTYTSPLDDLDRIMHQLGTITRAQCEQRFREIWTGSKHFVLSLQQGSVERTPEQAQRDFFTALERPTPLRRKENHVLYEAADYGPSGKMVDTKDYPETGVTEVTYDNNVALAIRPISNVSGLVEVAVEFGGGNHSAPLEQPGLSEFLQTVYYQAGVGNLHQRELARALRKRDVSWEFQALPDRFRLVGWCASHELKKQCQILRDLLLTPSWHRDSRFEYSRSSFQRLQHIENYFHSNVFSLLTEKKLDLLTDGDPRYDANGPEALTRRTVRELGEWIDADRMSGPLAIRIQGDVEVLAAMGACGATFGAIPTRESLPPEESGVPAVAGAPQVHQLITTGEARSTGILYLALPAEPLHSTPVAHRQLEVLTAILRNRVYRLIREKLGLSYAPTVKLTLVDGTGCLNFVEMRIWCLQKNFDRVAREVRGILDQFALEEISEDEYQKALLPLQKWLPLRWESAAHWSKGLRNQTHRFPDALDYRTATLARMNELAQELLGKEKLHEIRVSGP